MRFLLIALTLALALMYFTFGLRFGYVTLTPTYLFNATGENSYSYEVYEPGQSVGVQGSCQVRSGSATFRLIDDTGKQLAGQVCVKGQWALDVVGKGKQQGRYRLTIELQKFTGVIDVKETRSGPGN